MWLQHMQYFRAGACLWDFTNTIRLTAHDHVQAIQRSNAGWRVPSICFLCLLSGGHAVIDALGLGVRPQQDLRSGAAAMRWSTLQIGPGTSHAACLQFYAALNCAIAHFVTMSWQRKFARGCRTQCCAALHDRCSAYNSIRTRRQACGCSAVPMRHGIESCPEAAACKHAHLHAFDHHTLATISAMLATQWCHHRKRCSLASYAALKHECAYRSKVATCCPVTTSTASSSWHLAAVPPHMAKVASTHTTNRAVCRAVHREARQRHQYCISVLMVRTQAHMERMDCLAVSLCACERCRYQDCSASSGQACLTFFKCLPHFLLTVKVYSAGSYFSAPQDAFKSEDASFAPNGGQFGQQSTPSYQPQAQQQPHQQQHQSTMQGGPPGMQNSTYTTTSQLGGSVAATGGSGQPNQSAGTASGGMLTSNSQVFSLFLSLRKFCRSHDSLEMHCAQRCSCYICNRSEPPPVPSGLDSRSHRDAVYITPIDAMIHRCRGT